jgi:hypothetical protein
MIIQRIITNLGAFAKLQEATIKFVMSVRQSVCPTVCPSARLSARMEQFDCH